MHLATHGQFAAEAAESFLLTAQGKLTMQHLAQIVGRLRFRDRPLELLTLSACETASGDDRAALGLAGVALQAGARSAVATLWLVHDEAAAVLMGAFYRSLQVPGTSRARALQQAQLHLAQGPHVCRSLFLGAVSVAQQLVVIPPWRSVQAWRASRPGERTAMMTRHPPISPQLPRRVMWLSSSSLLLVLWLAVSSAQVQVRTTLTPDGTLGTTVTPNGNVYTIAGGTRPGNGPNLFHSFDRFSVGTNDTALFTATGPAGIKHILSRVTGGQRSEIDGTLQSKIPGAHLYLLNPSGVMFGPHATLDVPGSFHVSTADYLRLADGARFFARLSEQSTFSVAPPVAFGFLGPTPRPITVNGSELKVARGETQRWWGARSRSRASSWRRL